MVALLEPWDEPAQPRTGRPPLRLVTDGAPGSAPERSGHPVGGRTADDEATVVPWPFLQLGNTGTPEMRALEMAPQEMGALEMAPDDPVAVRPAGAVGADRWATGTDVRLRRRARARHQVLRRRTVFAAVVLTAAGLLAVPFGPLGRGAGAGEPPLAAGQVYVVQPGDTLWSIASRVVPDGDPRPVVAQLEGQTGSDHLVPGEHVHLP